MPAERPCGVSLARRLRTERDTLKDELAGALADLEKARAEADAAKMARERAEELLGEAKAKATRLTNQLGSADAQVTMERSQRQHFRR